MPSTKKKIAALILAVTARYLLNSSKYIRQSSSHHRRQRNRIEKRKRRRCWVKVRNKVINENKNEQKEPYYCLLKMDEDEFKLLLQFVEKDITKKNTTMRMAYPADEKLQVALRFLANGESYRRLEQVTGLSTPFLSANIPPICEAIYENLKDKYLKFPTTINEWREISGLFLDRHDFPLCLGAIYEKRILFRSFRNDEITGCTQTYTTILAVVDANYKFIYVEFDYSGQPYAEQQTSFFERSQLKQMLENSNTFPKDGKIDGNNDDQNNDNDDKIIDKKDNDDDDNSTLPYMFIGGKNLPLHERLLVPYKTECKITATNHHDDNDKKYKEINIFNERLNDAIESVEKSFLVFKHYFKILKTLSVKKEQMQSILLACFTLHNFLMEECYAYEDSLFTIDIENIDEQDTLHLDADEGGSNIENAEEINSNLQNEDVRHSFAQYFLKQRNEKNKANS